MARWIFVLTGVLLGGCIEPYNPPEVERAENYLVVDGFFNVGEGEVVVTLSRTQNLADEGPPPIEGGAQVEIQTEAGQTFQLIEVEVGDYRASGLAVSPDEKCRLQIRTTSGREYQSDYVVPKLTPPIDSITWSAEPQALNIQVTTHDPTGQSEFYRWSMVETAQYYAGFYSAYIFDVDLNAVRFRTPDETAYGCWKETALSSIKVATSRNFEYDLIDKFTLVSLESSSWKHKIKYSLLVKQYAISEEEYNYWTQLKKNTESVGTIFDPQPSEPIGNVHSISDPSEPVLGYFSAGTESSDRIFITAGDLPYKFYLTGYESCAIDTVLIDDFWNAPENYPIVYEYVTPMGSVYAYGVSSPFCIDCRIAHQGVTTRPDYWQ